jgi:hypothetical protein
LVLHFQFFVFVWDSGNRLKRLPFNGIALTEFGVDAPLGLNREKRSSFDASGSRGKLPDFALKTFIIKGNGAFGARVLVTKQQCGQI